MLAFALSLALCSVAAAAPNTYLEGQWWKGLSMKERLDGQLHQRKVARNVIEVLEDPHMARLAPAATDRALRKARHMLAVLRREVPETRKALREAAAVPPPPATASLGVSYGPWAIPAYIVMCESGGDYGAVNSSSGAYGAYQIMPGWWSSGSLCGDLSMDPAGQDECARRIWKALGASQWACA
jgi:hypothetical protein